MNTLKSLMLTSTFIPFAANTEASGASKSPVSREAEAQALAMTADTDTGLSSDLERAVVSKEEHAFSGVLLYLDLLRVLGKEGLDSLPVPGSKEEDGANNPDIYKRPSRRKGGGVGTANASYCNDFADNLKYIRESIIAVLDKAKEDAAANRISPRQKDEIEGKYQARLSSARTKVKAAIMLHHQLAKADAYAAVTVEWVEEEQPVLGEDGEPKKKADGTHETEMVIVQTDKPICVVSVANPRKDFSYFSVQQFNTLDFGVALSTGGTYASLVATLRTGGGADDETGDGIAVDSLDAVESAIAGVVHFLEDSKNYNALVALLAKADGDTDAYLLTLSELKANVDGLIAKHSKRIADIENKQAAAKNVA